MLTENRHFDEFINWCKVDALPYWAKAAVRPEGGVHEFLNMDGTPVTGTLQRMRVQARFAYVYAHAGALGWYEDARAVSDHAWYYLLGAGSVGGEIISGSGYKGCAHLLNPDHSLHDGLRDTYAQAFVILAGAWRYIAFKDKVSLKIATDTLALLDTHMKADNGGYLEGLPASLPRRQNPHMHLFEALLAMYDATGEQEYISHLGELYALFKDRFFDSKSGTIIEFFKGDWSRAAQNGGPVEPGHMMEWCWLLQAYQDRSGVDVNDIANTLYQTALDNGMDKNVGFLRDCLDNKPASFRTWPQTELLKASLVQAKAGNFKATEMANRTVKRMFLTYLDVPMTGGWCDQLGADGNPISTIMPTSTFYHLFCAAAETARFI